MAYVDYSKFDIKKLLKNFLIEISKEILEKQLEADDIKEEENKIIVKNKEFQLKNCLMDELGTNTFVDVNYKPKHRRYKTTENGVNVYVIEVEIPGGVEDFKQTLEIKMGNNIITIKGKKKSIKIINKKEKKEDDKKKEKKEDDKKKEKIKDDKKKEKIKDDKKEDKKVTKNTKNKKNTENDIEFELDIKIPLDVVQLDKFLKCEKENGIYKLIYSIITNESDSDTVNLENEEEEDDEDDENDNNDDDDDDDDNNNNNNDDDDDDDDDNNRDKETNENETKATESKNNNDESGSDDSD
jgi:hypothetical protein